MRVCNSIANDLYRLFSTSYIGFINNDNTGRNLFKSAVVSYMLDLQGNSAIRNFIADDVTVAAGTAMDSIVITVAVQPIDAVEKIYMTVTVG